MMALPALPASPKPAPDSSRAAFDQNVGRFVKQNCAVCHNDQLKTAGLLLTRYHDTASVLRDRAIWEKVVARVRGGEMPPKGLPRPKPEDIATMTAWIEAQFAEADESSKPDPGHLTAHRLNRAGIQQHRARSARRDVSSPPPIFRPTIRATASTISAMCFRYRRC